MPTELMYHKVFGAGKPLVILHGLFGASDNWSTLANRWSENFKVIICDARNHGRSFHSDNFSYEVMAEDLKNLLDHLKLKEVFLLGHSMGGKTSMLFAQKFPEYLKALLVADIGPKSYPPHHDEIIEAFESVDLSITNTRSEAAEQVSKVLSDEGVIQFLLKNLYWADKGQLGWRINLPVLKEKITKVTEALPKDEIHIPTLFLRGSKSNYILNDDWPHIKEQFTQSHLVTVKNAGHWLHAEQAEAFYQTVTAFLNKQDEK